MRFVYAFAAGVAVMATAAGAGAIRKFDDAAFHSLQAKNAPTIVFVHAPWCPVCRAQETTIRKLLTTAQYQDVTVLTIDYDTQKALWTSFGVQKQSTLIAYHGRRETARLSYDADPAKVTALVASTLR